MKHCPHGHGELTPVDIGAIEIDRCATCEGLWLDNDELRQFKDAADPDLHWVDFDLLKHEEQLEGKHSKRPCPICRDLMVSIGYQDTSVDIEYCPACRGTWLEPGEIEAILDALEQEVLTKPFSDYVQESLKEAREIVTGPESFLSEWKDFTTVLRLTQYRLFVDHPKFLEAMLTLQRANPFR